MTRGGIEDTAIFRLLCSLPAALARCRPRATGGGDPPFEVALISRWEICEGTFLLTEG